MKAILKNACGISLLVFLAAACSKSPDLKQDHELNASERNKAEVASACTTGCWLGVTNQSNKELEFYSYYAADWNVSTARKWNWKPTTARLYNGTTEVPYWGNPNDFKLRDISAWSGTFGAAVGSSGLITIFDYSTGNRRWAVTVPSADNIHGVDLLPNGNVAVAASTGDWVKIWGSSSGGTSVFTYTLNDAHQVLWDPAYNCLWAVGSSKLVKLTVGGPASAPTLTLATSYSLPTGGGHSIGAKYGNTSQLYVSTGSKVYVFTKNATDVPGNWVEVTGVSKVGVKAVSNQPDGIVVVTRPDDLKAAGLADPAPYHPDWNTSYVDYYSTAGVYLSSGHRVGASFYRGFVYNTNYQ